MIARILDIQCQLPGKRKNDGISGVALMCKICIGNRNMFAVAPKRLIISKNKDGALCRNAQGTTI